MKSTNNILFVMYIDKEHAGAAKHMTKNGKEVGRI